MPKRKNMGTGIVGYNSAIMVGVFRGINKMFKIPRISSGAMIFIRLIVSARIKSLLNNGLIRVETK